MEESLSSVQIHSRKRKKSAPSSSNSNPLKGILTRSKSRVYFHQNRSGVSRPDPFHGKCISSQPQVGTVESFLDMNCINASRVSSIKDLRMRRVFTPDLSSVVEQEEGDVNKERNKILKDSEAGSDSNLVLHSDMDDAKVDVIMTSEVEDERNDVEISPDLKDQANYRNESPSKSKMALNGCVRRKVFKNSSSLGFRRLLPYLMDIVNDESNVSKVEIVDAGVPCKLQKLDSGKKFDDANPSENEDVQKFHTEVPSNQSDLNGAENELCKVEQIGHGNEAGKNDAPAEEQCSHTTPPDPDIFIKTEVGHGRESIKSIYLIAENQNFNSDVLKRSPTSKHGTNSINRSVLNPCSRPRLFKNPGSVSYRRLLPFLMDISKNNSCASRIAQHPVPQVNSKEDLCPVLTATAEQNNLKKIRTENAHEKQCTEPNLLSAMVPLPTSDSSSPDTQNSPVSSMPLSSSTNYTSKVEPNSVISETLPDPGMLIDLQIEQMPQSQSTQRNLELDSNCKNNSSASPPPPTINNVVSTKQSISEEHLLVVKPNMCLDMGLKLHRSNGDSIEKINFKQSSSQTEVSDVLRSPTSGSFKGILKRNRRGCRGLCNCLNCASFRLHADRAFEFSRNQMHDAEEVASELMKELAHLRLLMEKSFITDNNLIAIQFNPVLIKQACSKALETEKIAKERLSQLKCDLDVHCRIPMLLQPKVTFANCTEERAIPQLDSSTSKEKKG